MASPLPSEVVQLRESMQARMGLGITAAQDLCAGMLHTSRRAWQQWERGERTMHPAFWELACAKSAQMSTRLPFGCLSANEQARAKAMFFDARLNDGYLYELDSDGRVLCRYRSARPAVG